uniref:Integrase catalytic domain-containing protein n=1 Tax=Trichogramma kaykai TaxID=54128 RepID=A0ABD2W6C7_9HYME
MTTQASNAQVVLAMATGCEKARPAVVDATAVTECLPDLCKYSNFHRIISVIYHFYRWHFRANKRAADGSKLLDADIWRKARWCCFKMIQAHHFKEEIQAIKNKKPISRRSHLARLAPMFGRDELLRVGGRLQNAQLSYDETHPIILPGECIIVRRLIEYEHREETMHGGAQLMRSQLARQFWITLGERIVQSVCRACIKCTRYRAVPVEQQMAPLPAVRVTPARAFKSIGLDYAGPLPVLFSRAKKASTSKGYVAIFICLITLAVHIEIVSDLTADAFLAAYARFVARKGRPSIIFSDNGTTFKGAARELKELFDESSVLTDRARVLGLGYYTEDAVSPTKHPLPGRCNASGGTSDAYGLVLLDVAPQGRGEALAGK